ncbi:MAG: WD40 repeat domain-containing protein, partial [Acidimicrobiales bacterium]
GTVVTDSPTAVPEPTSAPTPEPTSPPEPTPVAEPTPAEEPTVPTAPSAPVSGTGEAPIGITLETARALLDALGGAAGLVEGVVAEDAAWTSATFDPLDNRRLLLGELDSFDLTRPQLWVVEDGGVEASILPWVEEADIATGGSFSRDGTMVLEGGFSSREHPILDNNGELIAQVEGARVGGELGGAGCDDPGVEGDLGILRTSQGSTLVSLSTGCQRIVCPYESVRLSSPGRIRDVDETLNAFTRVTIPEPDVVVAFPYFPEKDSCEPTASTIARAWDINTGEPLPDYPLDGLVIARASVSANGSRAIVLDPDSHVRVLSMETGETLAELGSASSGRVANPLSLNTDGSLASVAEEDGTFTLWHVDAGEILLQATSSTREVGQAAFLSRGVTTTASLAHDSSRVALVDDALQEWTVLTLDPNDWLERACAAGFTISAGERGEMGLDPNIPCG